MDTASLDLLSYSVPSAKDIHEHAFEAVGTFSLTDDKTCGQPRVNDPCPPECNRQILNIESEEPLTIVSFDEWQTENPESKCDYLLFDSGKNKNQFAFCELTCSLGKYVEADQNRIGKRAKAYAQMLETWRIISESENPIFKAQVLQYVRKIGIFGWRDRVSGNHTGPMNSLRGFTRTPSSTAGITRLPNFAFGEDFDFIQVKYPRIFHWYQPQAH